MSFASGAIVVAAGALEDILFRMANRGIAGFIPNVVISEQAEDELQITEHPVESGANITDHSFKKPARLSVTYGWSQSGNGIPGIGTLGLGVLSGAPSPSEIYQTIRDLQSSRNPLDVVTGKRVYKNMLISRVTVVTEKETENCLLVDIDLQEILIVSTSTTTGGNINTGTLATPAANSGTTNTGQQQGRDVSGQNSDAALAAAGVDFSVPPTDTGP